MAWRLRRCNVLTLLVAVEVTEGLVHLVTEYVVAECFTDSAQSAPAAFTRQLAVVTHWVLVTLGVVTGGAEVLVADGTL